MPVIKVQKIPKPEKIGTPIEDQLAQFCFYFQQYTFAQARKLPQRRINQMLKVAEREYAKKMIDLLNITVSVHTKKASGVKELHSHYKSILDS
jgi:hypothetical protein